MQRILNHQCSPCASIRLWPIGWDEKNVGRSHENPSQTSQVLQKVVQQLLYNCGKWSEKAANNDNKGNVGDIHGSIGTYNKSVTRVKYYDRPHYLPANDCPFLPVTQSLQRATNTGLKLGVIQSPAEKAGSASTCWGSELCSAERWWSCFPLINLQHRQLEPHPLQRSPPNEAENHGGRVSPESSQSRYVCKYWTTLLSSTLSFTSKGQD